MTDAEIIRRYHDALESIAKLADVKEVRGPLEDLGTPEHLVKDGGWVSIHPQMKRGLCHAANIAKTALDDVAKGE